MNIDLGVNHSFLNCYSGDLIGKHLNSGNIWIKNFYLFAIQITANSLLFKSWSEKQTKMSLFKPSVTQPISQTPWIETYYFFCWLAT